MTATILYGDNMTRLRSFADCSFDACVTDPPYGLKFMGRKWDHNVPNVETWREVLRVLKPGAYLLAFSGTRTYHRMTVNIEDAGFEIRDQLQWIYGSGFPKSHNLEGERNGWGTALKPAHEPICMARKPFRGTVAANVRRWGTGAINVDACRIPAEHPTGWGGGGSAMYDGGLSRTGGEALPVDGRWPANVIHDGSDEVVSLFPVTGPSKAAEDHGTSESIFLAHQWKRGASHTDAGGSAARFFYSAKASQAEREAGLIGLPLRAAGGLSGRHDGTLGSITMRRNHHNTVKPIALMRHLLRLVTPPGGVVLDPFAGSGSTGCATALEGFDFVGIELDTEYAVIAERRVTHWMAESCRR